MKDAPYIPLPQNLWPRDEEVAINGWPWPRDAEKGQTYLIGPNDETWAPDADETEDEDEE
jgi:hypothetical protein